MRLPLSVFDGEKGVKLEMKRVAAFTEVDNDAESLFDYDVDRFIPNKPEPSPGTAWPSGDGRGCRSRAPRAPSRSPTSAGTAPSRTSTSARATCRGLLGYTHHACLVRLAMHFPSAFVCFGNWLVLQ
eukprot:TRINITY_DN297_c0_g1_i8.p2 TRINITY_DN297_c0_g1~~TRINITY_DN297_c0_g1_i8.p2  ORF type:complete len:127 (-),score=18.32 TRINITY_DN297_c0_g1_i8:137-517(-)